MTDRTPQDEIEEADWKRGQQPPPCELQETLCEFTTPWGLPLAFGDELLNSRLIAALRASLIALYKHSRSP